MIREALHKAGIIALDTELLLAHVLCKDRAWLMAHPDTLLSVLKQKQFDELVERRKKGEPVAYLIGKKEFYGRDFSVDKRVLIPRPSTETLIDEVKKYFAGEMQSGTRSVKADTDIVIFSDLKHSRIPKRIIDIGTGSGCIGITLALEIPEVNIICTDISENALKVARANAEHHGVLDRITLMQSNLLETFNLQPSTKNFLVVSNPPYIPEREKLPKDISAYEPHEALYAGSDGIDVLRELYKQCRACPLCIGCVFECRSEHSTKLVSAAESQKIMQTF